MGCAVGTCVDPDCYLCTVVAKIKPPSACAKPVEGGRCSLVLGHPRWVACRSKSGGRAEQATRDGAPKLAGERKRDLIFTPRKRVGPHRSNA
jgi:hypothetical protein